MIKKLYAIYDKKAEMEMGIFEHPNDLVAMRDFSVICNNKEHHICKFAEDYCLVRLGEIDTKTMTIVSEPKTIAEAKDYSNQ